MSEITQESIARQIIKNKHCREINCYEVSDFDETEGAQHVDCPLLFTACSYNDKVELANKWLNQCSVDKTCTPDTTLCEVTVKRESAEEPRVDTVGVAEIQRKLKATFDEFCSNSNTVEFGQHDMFNAFVVSTCEIPYFEVSGYTAHIRNMYAPTVSIPVLGGVKWEIARFFEDI